MPHSTEAPSHWRLRKQRYGLVGEVCPTCVTKIFPPRDLCPECKQKTVVPSSPSNPRGKKESASTKIIYGKSIKPSGEGGMYQIIDGHLVIDEKYLPKKAVGIPIMLPQLASVE